MFKLVSVLKTKMKGINSLLFVDDAYTYIASDYDKDPSLMISKKFNVAEENITKAGEEMKKIFTHSTLAEDTAAFVRVRIQHNIDIYFFKVTFNLFCQLFFILIQII